MQDIQSFHVLFSFVRYLQLFGISQVSKSEGILPCKEANTVQLLEKAFIAKFAIFVPPFLLF